jgi:hypothetical protein
MSFGLPVIELAPACFREVTPMSIEFRCPNGHRLSCPDDRAGMSGVCPKCKATFRVPDPGDPPPATSDSTVSEPEMTEAQGDEPLAAAATHETPNPAEKATDDERPASKESAVAEERIVFLCPNGHKLNCPASMQGRPGKCPHCGATFLVPDYEPEEAGESSEPSDEQTAAEEPALQSVDEPLIEIGDFNGAAYEADSFAFDFTGVTEAPDSAGVHAMAGLFQRLWLYKRTGGIVELYLKGGEVIAPEWYASRFSQEAYGMFAYQEADGSTTLTAIHWDAIERMAVRRVNALPQGMFDED